MVYCSKALKDWEENSNFKDIILEVLSSHCCKILISFFSMKCAQFSILTPYLMVLGKYLVGSTCQKSEKNVNILKLT